MPSDIPIIKKHLIVISGFLQSEHGHTGSSKLWRMMGFLRNEHTVVSLREWNTDWKDYALKIARLANEDKETPVIRIFGYSWGGGWGAMRLCWYLRANGLPVSSLVLCDAVYRSRWLTLSWKSLTRDPKIKIPDNVRGDVFWFRQRRDKPSGHTLIVAGKFTTLNKPVWLDLTHKAMDDSPEYHKKALEVAGNS